MKKIICICSVLLFSFTATFAKSSADVNEKVIKIFKIGFPDVKDASWATFENYYQVFFKSNDCTTRVNYDLEGNLLSTLCYYGEPKLPSFIRAKVCAKYPGKSIYGVTELTTENEHAYHLVLNDEKYWYNVKADENGRISLEKKLKKA